MKQEEILSLLGEGDFKKIALLIGVENALKISEVFGGLVITVPRLLNIRRLERDRIIRQTYDHKAATARRLAIKYGLSMRQIYNILGTSEGGKK